MVNMCRPNGVEQDEFPQNVLQQGHAVVHSHALYEGEYLFGSALYLISSLGGRSLATAVQTVQYHDIIPQCSKTIIHHSKPTVGLLV